MDEVLTAKNMIPKSPSSSSSIGRNLPLVSAFLAFSIAQFLKLFTTWFKEKRWDSRRLYGSGGMPSSHSATVTALAVAIALQEGCDSSSFALAVILAVVVMYDASGVRLHAGRQAEVLNQIVCEFPPEHPLSTVRPLRELLGHTPLQVKVNFLWRLMPLNINKIRTPLFYLAIKVCAGAVLGVVVSFLVRNSL